MAFWQSQLGGFRLGVAPGYLPHKTTKIMPLKYNLRRASTFALSTMAHAAWAISLRIIYQCDDTLLISLVSGPAKIPLQAFTIVREAEVSPFSPLIRRIKMVGDY